MLILCRVCRVAYMAIRFIHRYKHGNIVSSVSISFRVFGDTFRLTGIG